VSVVDVGSVKTQSPNPKSQDPIEAQAVEVIDRALTGAQAPCITSSFQAECVVLTHMLLQRRPDIPVPPQNFRSNFLEENYLNKK